MSHDRALFVFILYDREKEEKVTKKEKFSKIILQHIVIPVNIEAFSSLNNGKGLPNVLKFWNQKKKR